MSNNALKGGVAILAIILAGALAACEKNNSEQGWYLLVSDPNMPAVVNVSPFGNDKAKCDEFAAKFTKYARTNIQSRCVSGEQLAQMEQARRVSAAIK